jgi:translation initiation factor 6 (eIF-6)
LDVTLVELSIADANIVGSLLTINSNGAIVTDLVDAVDIKIIEDQGLDVFVIEDKRVCYRR